MAIMVDDWETPNYSLFTGNGLAGNRPPITPPGQPTWWGKDGYLSTGFAGAQALGSLYNAYATSKNAKAQNELFAQQLSHTKAMDLENLRNLRATTSNEIERQAFNAQQLGASVPVYRLPDSQLINNESLRNLNVAPATRL